MNTLYKRIGYFALVLVLMFCMFTSPVVAPKAEASVTLTVAGISVIVWVLGLLGISFATAGAMTQSAQSFYDSSPSTVQAAINYLSTKISTTTQLWTLVGAEAWPKVQTVVTAVWNYFNKPAAATGAGSVAVPDKNWGYYGDVKVCYKESFVDAKEAYSFSMYSCKNYTENNPLTISVNGVDFNFYCVTSYPAHGGTFYQFKINSKNFLAGNSEYGGFWTKGLSTIDELVDFRLGFRFVNINGGIFLYPFTSVCYVDTSGKFQYQHAAPDSVVEGRGLVQVSGADLIPETMQVPYNLEVMFQLKQLLLELQKILTAVGSIDIPMDIPWEYTEEGKREEAGEKDEDKPLVYAPEAWWLALWEFLGLKVDVSDPPIGGSNGDNKFDVPTMPSLKDKFPFCIPFDLIALVGALNATPVTPKWTIPIRFDSVNFSYDVVIDLAKYEQLAVPLRWGLTLMFLLGLILITRKLIKG